MIKLSEYISKVLDNHSIYLGTRLYHANQANELYDYFDGNIPEYIEDKLISGEKFEDLMLEHLRNINSKYILKDLQEYFEWCYDIKEVDDIIYMMCKENPRKNEDFLKLINIYQYNIKTSYKLPNNTYKVHIEKNFPEDVTDKVNKDREDRYVFHITKRSHLDSILKNGFRPGYHYDDPKNINKQIWKLYKESHDKEEWNKNYFFYIPNFYINNENIKKLKEYANEVANTLNINKENAILVSIHLPEAVRVYEDKSMPMENCCFTYSKIPSINVKEIKNTFK